MPIHDRVNPATLVNEIPPKREPGPMPLGDVLDLIDEIDGVDTKCGLTSATISLYRLGNTGKMFPGFPQTISVGGQLR
jgi:hypothetical protein